MTPVSLSTAEVTDHPPALAHQRLELSDSASVPSPDGSVDSISNVSSSLGPAPPIAVRFVSNRIKDPFNGHLYSIDSHSVNRKSSAPIDDVGAVRKVADAVMRKATTSNPVTASPSCMLVKIALHASRPKVMLTMHLYRRDSCETRINASTPTTVCSESGIIHRLYNSDPSWATPFDLESYLLPFQEHASYASMKMDMDMVIRPCLKFIARHAKYQAVAAAAAMSFAAEKEEKNAAEARGHACIEKAR